MIIFFSDAGFQGYPSIVEIPHSSTSFGTLYPPVALEPVDCFLVQIGVPSALSAVRTSFSLESSIAYPCDHLVRKLSLFSIEPELYVFAALRPPMEDRFQNSLSRRFSRPLEPEEVFGLNSSFASPFSVYLARLMK